MNAPFLNLDAVRDAYARTRAAEREKRGSAWLEPEFLPAALELVERPVSPTARLTARLLTAGALLTIGWLIFGKVDVVASAPGTLMPVDNVKVVQPSFGGTIRHIYIHDGDNVRRGQILVDLDPTFANADEAEARKALLAAQLDVARNKALVDGLKGETGIYVAPSGTPPEVAATQRQLVAAALAAQVAQRRSLAASRDASMRDAAAAVQTVNTYDATAPMLRSQVAAVTELQKKGFASRFRVLELQRQLRSDIGNRAVAEQQAAKGRSESAHYAQAIAQSDEDTLRAALQDLATAQNDAMVRAEALAKAQQQRRMQRLTAPVDGVVQQLAVHTVGGVVEAAKPLMVVVPEGALTVEARLPNREAGFVRPNQKVAVKIDAYPFTRYGTVPGIITSISRDAVQDGDKPAYYTARITLQRQYIEAEGRHFPLRSGLNATADIRTGSRRLISYLLDPVTGGLSEAARER